MPIWHNKATNFQMQVLWEMGAGAIEIVLFLFYYRRLWSFELTIRKHFDKIVLEAVVPVFRNRLLTRNLDNTYVMLNKKYGHTDSRRQSLSDLW
jgi:hypothetical protein